jgi:glycosyltransferase involved in cell wall biosynthesis
MDRPPLSVVIATRDRPGPLATCLAGLTAVLGPDDEVVVVDSASADGRRIGEVAASYGVRCVRLDRAGASLARNAGWRAAAHEQVAFVDDDVHVLPGWADAMARALAAPGIAFVTGWIGVPPGQEDVPGPLPLMVVPHGRELTTATRDAFGAGANWGARRPALLQVGGFDERLGPGTWFAAAEDVDLFDRLVLAGCVGRYHPEVRVDHDMWRGRWERVRLHWRYGKGMGARLAKLSALDPPRCRRETYDALWAYGLRALVDEARSRWVGGVLSSVARLLGTLVGLAAGVVALRPGAAVTVASSVA